ncbi:MAG: hypothetical protein NXI07_13165, partial [bacterium]|nr:hypothetical protein [bacterium]
EGRCPVSRRRLGDCRAYCWGYAQGRKVQSSACGAHALEDERILLDQQTLINIDAIDPNELARMQREGCCPDLSCCTPNQTIHSTPTAQRSETETV